MNYKTIGNLDHQLFDELRNEFCHKKLIPTYKPVFQPKNDQSQVRLEFPPVIYVVTGDFINADRIESLSLLRDLVPM